MADKGSEALKGGPGVEGEQGAEGKGQEGDLGGASKRVKMKVGDREIEVDEGVAVLLEEQQRGFQEYQGQVNRYIRQLATQQPVAKPDKKDDAPPSFFDDPEGFMAHHLQQSEERLKGYVNETLTKTQKKQNEREFWSEFYEDNDDLRGAEMIVEGVFQRNLDSLADMKVSQAKRELSKLARSELERMLQSRKPNGSDDTGGEGDQRSMRQVVLGAGARGPGKGDKKAGEGDEGKQPTTLGAVLKARRAARMSRRGTQH